MHAKRCNILLKSEHGAQCRQKMFLGKGIALLYAQLQEPFPSGGSRRRAAAALEALPCAAPSHRRSRPLAGSAGRG